MLSLQHSCTDDITSWVRNVPASHVTLTSSLGGIDIHRERTSCRRLRYDRESRKRLFKTPRVRGYAIGSGTERPGETLSCTSKTWSPSKLLSPKLGAEEGGMLTRIVMRGTQNGILHGRPCSGRRAWRIFPGRTSQAPSFTPSCDIIASLFAYSLAFRIIDDSRDTCSDATDHLYMTTRQSLVSTASIATHIATPPFVTAP